MKKKSILALITFCLFFLISLPVFSSGTLPGKKYTKINKRNKIKFVHGTYFLNGYLKNKTQLNQIQFEQFDFIYLMAVPHWTAKDFKMPEKEIMKKLVDNFSYSKNHSANPLVPKLISKAHQKNVKVLLSVSGDDRLKFVACNSTNRAVFARVMAAIVKKNNYDGIDIDWESSIVIDQHIKLMAELRKALNSLEKKTKSHKRKYYITTALNVFMEYSKEPSRDLSRSIDWVNVMTYDMGGGTWGHVATHNTPLNKMKDLLDNNWSYFSPDKICIGLANYGFYYKGVSPGQESKESLKKKGRYFSYKELPALLKKGWKESYDTKAEAPYYFKPDKSEFITIDNKQSLTRKMEWIFKKKFRGVFWWEYHHDWLSPSTGHKYAVHPLIDHVTKIIKTSKQK